MTDPIHTVPFAEIGEAISLLAQVPFYADRSLAEIGDLVLPPLALGQSRIWRRGTAPAGLATWAWLDAETEAAVLYDDYQLPPTAWAMGNRPVVVDIVAPFGDGFAIARDLSRSVFPDRAVRAVRRDSTGRARRIVQFPGLRADGTRAPSQARIA